MGENMKEKQMKTLRIISLALIVFIISCNSGEEENPVSPGNEPNPGDYYVDIKIVSEQS